MTDNPAIQYSHNSLKKIENSRYTASLRLSVAPMLDWTDTHCRSFHRILAPDARLYTEMVHANAVLKGDRDRLLGFDPAERPLALQLGGSVPATLAAASRIGEEWGYDEINLNVGCPSDRVQAGRFGACLMKEPTLVADCIAAMMAVTRSSKITVKCRLGVDEDRDFGKFLAFIDTVAATGCDSFVVHARAAWLQGLSPKENRDIPPLRYDWVHQLKNERPGLRIVINGGIGDIDAVLEQLRHCDGVMLGRAAYHDPYLLHELNAALYGSPLQDRAELLASFRPHVEARLGEGTALKHMTRHILGLYHGKPGGRRFRQILSEGAHHPEAGWNLVEQAVIATE
ncbi:MAG: tRNA dihydrouridine(20/20a) synthase DusA [Xanthomonadaceae bacterium]|jgi:tRNA-dihydrouridine synthase A|nr:tRNA dihydrouridine(20/20a) synthase DusA [Xanthomonadaceae bacterium]